MLTITGLLGQSCEHIDHRETSLITDEGRLKDVDCLYPWLPTP